MLIKPFKKPGGTLGTGPAPTGVATRGPGFIVRGVWESGQSMREAVLRECRERGRCRPTTKADGGKVFAPTANMLFSL